HTSTTIIDSLDKYCKHPLPDTVKNFISSNTHVSGAVSVSLNKDQHVVRIPPLVWQRLKSEGPILAQLMGAPKGSGECVCRVKRGVHAQTGKTHLRIFKEHLSRMHIPVFDEYDFTHDEDTTRIQGDIKPTTSVRHYQRASLERMFARDVARSGIVCLPCGAGKTLVGVAAMARLGRCCLILCKHTISVHQWRNQIALFSTVPDSCIFTFTSGSRSRFDADKHSIVISTYSMVVASTQRSTENERVIQALKARVWGVIVLDEVHVAPAQEFSKALQTFRAHMKLGLTATPIREDDNIADLNYIIGPKLYEANWLDLRRDGFIAHVQCVEVPCPMPAMFFREYLRFGTSALHDRQKQLTLSAINPNKFRTVQYLIQRHKERGDKILVFCEQVWVLKQYANRLNYPYLEGGTNEDERLTVLGLFLTDDSCNPLFLSRVGDDGIDLPAANVVIQISAQFGSRRQETQRLGRILRPKPGMAGMGSEYPHAFFYDLVSTDTVEESFSRNRRAYLVDQGHPFITMPHLSVAAAHDNTLLLGDAREVRSILDDALSAKAEAQSKTEQKARAKSVIAPAAKRRMQGKSMRKRVTGKASHNQW
ncbi:helicase Ercc3, partial [Kipferlia bialata]